MLDSMEKFFKDAGSCEVQVDVLTVVPYRMYLRDLLLWTVFCGHQAIRGAAGEA
jgi:hypothetical protein